MRTSVHLVYALSSLALMDVTVRGFTQTANGEWLSVFISECFPSSFTHSLRLPSITSLSLLLYFRQPEIHKFKGSKYSPCLLVFGNRVCEKRFWEGH